MVSSKSAKTAKATTTKTMLTTSAPKTAEQALEVLRNEPGYDSLVATLQFLDDRSSSFCIQQPTPLAAQIVQVLVTTILPNYWPLLFEDENLKRRKKPHLDLLLACLRSVTGLSALLVRLRALTAEVRSAGMALQQRKNEPLGAAWQLRMLLQVLSELLSNESSVYTLWTASSSGIGSSGGNAQRRPLAQEFLGAVTGGKLVSLSGEAEVVLRESASLAEKASLSFWVADGRRYSQWLARSIIYWNQQEKLHANDRELGSELLEKALRLGYPGKLSFAVVSTLVSTLLLGDSSRGVDNFTQMLEGIAVYEQKKVFHVVLTYISEILLGFTGEADASIVSAVAALLHCIVGSSQPRLELLTAWLVASPAVGFINGVTMRRAAVAVVAQDLTALSGILGKTMADFADTLFIKHAPIMQQEAKAQVLLLSAGYISRQSKRSIMVFQRSPHYLSLVSNRLAASHNRARFLGMVVGEALSLLTDDAKTKLNFGMEEMATEDAQWYKGLVYISDSIGSVELLAARVKKENEKNKPAGHSEDIPARPSPLPKASKTKAEKRLPILPKKTGFVIEELDSDGEVVKKGGGGSDDEEEEDDDDDYDLVPYAKPDSDADDSDDDPTTIRRDKPKAPVYIRDLISYFRDTESYDKQRLALTTAPALIRRKANFGTEVQQHAPDLASILIGLQDNYEMDDFYHLKIQGLMALVVAQPRIMGPMFASSFFDGDYSLAQRASVLTALGFGVRELAGFEASEYAPDAVFPSKKLPDRVARLYSGDSTGSTRELSAASTLKPLAVGALDSITDSLVAGFLGPIAAKAADEATGPDVLKLSSFKSRVQNGAAKGKGTITKDRRSKNVTRSQATPANTVSPIIGAAFFFPLIARFQLALQATSSSSFSSSTSTPNMRRGVLFEPSLLSLYIKTLAVLVHAAGPGALALPDMTAELWELLLGSSVQAHCVGDVMVTQAVLFALLALLDVNEDRMQELCRSMPRQVVQTRDWAMAVLESTRGESSASMATPGAPGRQENDVQLMAAGIYLRLSEGIEQYRNLLLGHMIG